MKKTKPDNNKTLYPSTTPQKAVASLRAGSGGLYIIPLWDEVDKTPGGAVKRTVTYYPAAGATPALQRTQCGASVRINTVGGSNSVYYILKDHLGSASVVTDASGNPVSGSEQRYYPYGESRLTATMLTDKLFTRWVECATGAIETAQRDVGLGIYHYGARFRAAPLAKHTQRVRSEAEWGICPSWESHGSALFI